MTAESTLQGVANPLPQRLQFVRQSVGPLRDIAGAETDDEIAAGGNAVHQAREIGGKCFYEVYLDAAGSDASYEPPGAPDLKLDTHRYDLQSNALQIEQLLETAGVIHNGDRPAGGEFAI